MIHHIVLFRFRADTDLSRVSAAGDALRGMRGRIAEVRDVVWGPNVGPTARDYPWVLIVTVDDMDAVQRYAEHPLHREIVEQFITPIREARMAVDLEVSGGR